MGVSGGKLLRDLRKALGIADYELADKTKIPLETIQELETGTRVATAEEIKKIAFWLCPKDEQLLYGLLVPYEQDNK